MALFSQGRVPQVMYQTAEGCTGDNDCFNTTSQECILSNKHRKQPQNKLIPQDKPHTNRTINSLTNIKLAPPQAPLPIEPNAKTVFVRNILLNKSSDTCTATQIIVCITDFTHLHAATTLSLKTIQAATTLAAQHPASKPIS